MKSAIVISVLLLALYIVKIGIMIWKKDDCAADFPKIKQSNRVGFSIVPVKIFFRNAVKNVECVSQSLLR